MLNRKQLLLAAAALFAIGGCHKNDPSTLTVTPEPKKSEQAEANQEPEPIFEISMRCSGQRVPVIMYHDIIEKRDKNSVWFDCTTKEFQDQMDEIKANGYTPISLEDLHKHLTSGFTIPEKSIVLTFDDNYQGYFDRAYPILKQLGYPSVVFVHTGYVGNKTGLHPKMDWPTLKELVKDPLVTIGSHTITHPDLPSLTPTEQTKELAESKKELEAQLGKKIDFIAYPEGKNDLMTQSLTREAGYTMAFSVANGLAEESPSILCVNRYVHTRLDKAMEDYDQAVSGGAVGITREKIVDSPVTYKEQEEGGVKLALVVGGQPESITSYARESVLDFIHRSPGSVAGINGTFFNMAAIKATDNKLVGPSKTPETGSLQPDLEAWRLPKLVNRPLLVWGPSGFAIVPFNPFRMNDETCLADFMPDANNVFLGGAWLVHAGVAGTKDGMTIFASKDIMDPRRRAAFGIMSDGMVFAAASKNSVSSEKFGQALAAAGAKEAVLLDSGFSTSLVYNEKILASGHSTKDEPSRPVPHAIVFKGTLDPAGIAFAATAEPATKPDAGGTKRKKKKRKMTVEAPKPDDSVKVVPDTN